MTDHQLKQIEIINKIEEQVKNDAIQFTTVSPVEDYRTDPRVCLTSVHFPKIDLLMVADQIISTLKNIEPSYYYYLHPDLHLTIKNVRVINDPPHFTHDDISKVANVFSDILPKHKAYRAYFFRLMLFKNNLSLVGTTDEELDTIVLDLDQALKNVGIPDDKIYANNQYFFQSMTLARFPSASEQFIEKVNELSKTISMSPYLVDSVSLVAGNAVFAKRLTIKTWDLRL